MRRAGSFFVTLCFAAAAAAHHSPNLHFDRNEVAAISGEIRSVAWRNPHTELIVAAPDDEGREAEWVIDTRSASQFLRAGLDREMFQVGEPIRVAGFRGRRNRNALFVLDEHPARRRPRARSGQFRGPTLEPGAGGHARLR
ncbi:MAG: hypothetical protein GWN29_04635 [Gammaproteobacteria bacterium]|nr:hypothetical protein [Gammaproteobacteria bacterium]